MDIPDALLCVFTAPVEKQHGRFVMEIPDGEISRGPIYLGEHYRTAVLASGSPAIQAESPDPD